MRILVYDIQLIE